MVIQMNWPLPARQILIMQLGTIRGVLQRNKSKACRGSLFPNVTVLTEEETFARGDTVEQGLKERSPSLIVARLYFLFSIFGLCFKRKAVCTHAPHRSCSLTLLWQAEEFSVRVFVRTVINLAVLGRLDLSIKF